MTCTSDLFPSQTVTELVGRYDVFIKQATNPESLSWAIAYEILAELDRRFTEATSETWDDADRCEPHTVCLTRVKLFHHQCDMDPENCDPIDLDLSYDPDEEPYFPTCSICDGPGHGYVGGPPCPLEERGDYSNEPWWAQ